MEGDNDLGSMRFVPSFAPHTSVLPRATGDGIDAPRCGLRELRVSVHALYADLPARQGVGIRTLSHVGLLVGLIGGIGYGAERVEAPDFLLSGGVIQQGVDGTQIAMAGALWSQVDDFGL